MKKIACIILFSFLTCLMAAAQGYYKLLGDSSNFNSLTGCTRLQHGGILSYGRLYISSLGSPGRPAYCKTDDAGNVIWQRYVEYPGYNFYINAAVELPSGEFMFFNFYTNASNNDALLFFKTDSSGNVLWTKTYTSIIVNSRSIQHAVVAHDGNVLIGATIGSFSTIAGKQTIFKVDTAGTILWNSAFGGSGDDYLHEIQEGPDHCIYIIGERTYTFGGSPHATFSKMDSTGNVAWSKVYDLSTLRAYFRDMVMLPSGNFLIGGISNYVSPTYPFSFFLETDTSGNIVRHFNYNIPGVSLYANDIAMDSLNRIHLYGTVVITLPHQFFNLVADTSGSIISSWRMNAYITPGIQTYAGGAHVPDFYAGNLVGTGSYKWALMKQDSIVPFCLLQPLGASVFNQFPFTTSVLYPGTISYSFTTANVTLLQGTFNAVSNGCLTTAIEQHDVFETPVVAFPSPSRGIIRFNLPATTSSFTIYNAYGNLVYNNNHYYGGAFDFNCSRLAAGMYFLHFIQENKNTGKVTFMVGEK